jgi:hypothetical protein
VVDGDCHVLFDGRCREKFEWHFLAFLVMCMVFYR